MAASFCNWNPVRKEEKNLHFTPSLSCTIIFRNIIYLVQSTKSLSSGGRWLNSKLTCLNSIQSEKICKKHGKAHKLCHLFLTLIWLPLFDHFITTFVTHLLFKFWFFWLRVVESVLVTKSGGRLQGDWNYRYLHLCINKLTKSCQVPKKAPGKQIKVNIHHNVFRSHCLKQETESECCIF